MTGMWRFARYLTRLVVLLALAGGIQAAEDSLQVPAVSSERKFTIENNRFVKDGKPLQIISGRCARCDSGQHPVSEK